MGLTPTLSVCVCIYVCVHIGGDFPIPKVIPTPLLLGISAGPSAAGGGRVWNWAPPAPDTYTPPGGTPWLDGAPWVGCGEPPPSWGRGVKRGVDADRSCEEEEEDQEGVGLLWEEEEDEEGAGILRPGDGPPTCWDCFFSASNWVTLTCLVSDLFLKMGTILAPASWGGLLERG